MYWAVIVGIQVFETGGCTRLIAILSDDPDDFWGSLSCPSWRKRPLAVEVGQQSMPKSSAPVAAELWSLEGWVIHTWLIYNSSWNKNIVLNQQVRDTPREHMGRNGCFCDGASQFFSLKPPLPQTRTKRVLRFHGGFWAEPGSPGWVWEWGIDRQKIAILQF